MKFNNSVMNVPQAALLPHAVAVSLALGVLLALMSCASTQDSYRFETAPLYGMVYDYAGEPLQGATVSVIGSPASAADGAQVDAATGHEVTTVRTDALGRFATVPIASAAYHINIAAEDHESRSLTVDFVRSSDVLYVQLRSWWSLVLEAAEDARSGEFSAAADLLDRAEAASAPQSVGAFVRAATHYYAGEYQHALDALDALPERFQGLDAVRSLREMVELGQDE